VQFPDVRVEYDRPDGRRDPMVLWAKQAATRRANQVAIVPLARRLAVEARHDLRPSTGRLEAMTAQGSSDPRSHRTVIMLIRRRLTHGPFPVASRPRIVDGTAR
jgi:hypothetical protein